MTKSSWLIIALCFLQFFNIDDLSAQSRVKAMECTRSDGAAIYKIAMEIYSKEIFFAFKFPKSPNKNYHEFVSVNVDTLYISEDTHNLIVKFQTDFEEKWWSVLSVLSFRFDRTRYRSVEFGGESDWIVDEHAVESGDCIRVD